VQSQTYSDENITTEKALKDSSALPDTVKGMLIHLEM
jgi:hypothetical protein